MCIFDHLNWPPADLFSIQLSGSLFTKFFLNGTVQKGGIVSQPVLAAHLRLNKEDQSSRFSLYQSSET